jgi:hypothetical protein
MDSADFDPTPTTESASTDSSERNPGFRFEIIERESENEVRDKLLPRKHPATAVACDHTQLLGMLNDAMDRHAEVGNLLEIVARALFNRGWGDEQATSRVLRISSRYLTIFARPARLLNLERSAATGAELLAATLTILANWRQRPRSYPEPCPRFISHQIQTKQPERRFR